MYNSPMKKEGFEIYGQLVGLKNLQVTGGWRLSIDLFDSRLEDVLKVTTLVNERQTVRIALKPTA